MVILEMLSPIAFNITAVSSCNHLTPSCDLTAPYITLFTGTKSPFEKIPCSVLLKASFKIKMHLFFTFFLFDPECNWLVLNLKLFFFKLLFPLFLFIYY